MHFVPCKKCSADTIIFDIDRKSGECLNCTTGLSREEREKRDIENSRERSESPEGIAETKHARLTIARMRTVSDIANLVQSVGGRRASLAERGPGRAMIASFDIPLNLPVGWEDLDEDEQQRVSDDLISRSYRGQSPGRHIGNTPEQVDEIRRANAAVGVGIAAPQPNPVIHAHADDREETPVTFGFDHPEDGSGDRFASRRKKYNVPWTDHTFWWLVHNVISHPLIGFLPLKPFFGFHDWTSRRLHARK